MSVFLMVMSLERVSSPLIDISKATVAAAQFFALIDAPRPEYGSIKDPDVSASDDIVFSDVTFAYPSRPHVKILNNLNLQIEAGKVTAIVGPSGSGKSTIVGLIERWYTLHDQHIIAQAVEKDKKKNEEKRRKGNDDLYEPVYVEEKGAPIELKGSVLTSGHKIDELDLKWWRSQIGLVQQEPFLFNDTIENNVRFGLVGTDLEHVSEEVKSELVRAACKEAFADEFIDRLPEVGRLLLTTTFRTKHFIELCDPGRRCRVEAFRRPETAFEHSQKHCQEAKDSYLGRGYKFNRRSWGENRTGCSRQGLQRSNNHHHCSQTFYNHAG